MNEETAQKRALVFLCWFVNFDYIWRERRYCKKTTSSLFFIYATSIRRSPRREDCVQKSSLAPRRCTTVHREEASEDRIKNQNLRADRNKQEPYFLRSKRGCRISTTSSLFFIRLCHKHPPSPRREDCVQKSSAEE